MPKNTKKRIMVPLVCALTALSAPLFCVENTPPQSTPSQTVQAPEKSSQEDKAAVQRLQQAAEQGDKIAQLELGIAYVNGDDIEQDFEKAAHWFLKSAEQDEYHAIVSLMLLANDRGLSPATQIKVDAWLKAQGDKLPKLNLPPPAHAGQSSTSR